MIIGQVSDIVKYFSDDSSIFVFSFIALFTNASHDWNGVEQGCHFAKVYDEQMLYDFDASSSCTRINPNIMKAIAHLLSNKLYLGVSVDWVYRRRIFQMPFSPEIISDELFINV